MRRDLTDRNGADTITTAGLPAPNSRSAGTTYSAIPSRMAARAERRNRTPCDRFHSLNGTSIDKPTFILTAMSSYPGFFTGACLTSSYSRSMNLLPQIPLPQHHDSKGFPAIASAFSETAM